MKIKKLTLENFRGIRNLELEFHDRLTILVGINGTGKTSILDALAMGLSHCLARYYMKDENLPKTSEKNPSANQKPRLTFHENFGNPFWVEDKESLLGQGLTDSDIYNGEEIVLCDFFLKGKNHKSNSVSVDWRIEHSRITHDTWYHTGPIDGFFRSNVFASYIPYLIYLPISRTEIFFKDYTAIPDSTFEEIIEKKVPALETLKYIHETKTKVSRDNPISIVPSANFRDLLVALNFLQEQEQSTLHEMVSNGKIPTDESFRSRPLQSVFEAWKKILPDGFSRFTIKKNDRENLYLSLCKNDLDVTDSQLSGGEKALLSLAGAIALQLSYRTDENALDKPGIILIDEIELHLHPKWQREVVPRLLDVFPNCQFIVTTHSPQVLGGIREGKIVLLSNSEDGSITYKSYEENIFGMSSNDILTSLMGGGERDKYVAGQMKEFYGALEEEDFQTARTVLEELKKETDIPELEAMGMRLRRKELLKNEIHS